MYIMKIPCLYEKANRNILYADETHLDSYDVNKGLSVGSKNCCRKKKESLFCTQQAWTGELKMPSCCQQKI